jgi:hypothetical protein
MVVEIDACGFASAAIPSKDQSPLFIDADRMKISQFPAQLLEMIARGYPQNLGPWSRRRSSAASGTTGLPDRKEYSVTGRHRRKKRAVTRPGNRRSFPRS